MVLRVFDVEWDLRLCIITCLRIPSACGGVAFSKQDPGLVPESNSCYRISAVTILPDYIQAMLWAIQNSS